MDARWIVDKSYVEFPSRNNANTSSSLHVPNPKQADNSKES